MYFCTAPGLRLDSGKFAEVGAEVPDAQKWPHHIVDIHIRSGKLRYDGAAEHRAPKPGPLPERPKFTTAERERLAGLPSHQRELLAQRRGWPVEWLHEPHARPEPMGEGVQLTDAQRQHHYAEMPAEVVAMAAKARGVSVESLTGKTTASAPAAKADAEPPKGEPEPVKKGKGR